MRDIMTMSFKNKRKYFFEILHKYFKIDLQNSSKEKDLFENRREVLQSSLIYLV